MTNPFSEPTSEQCTTNAKVFEDGSRVGYAIWYPQMGGYVGRAIAVLDKEWMQRDDGAAFGGCIDVLIWHDGEFPFGEGEPREIHHCDPEQFIRFGEKLKELNSAGKKEWRE